MPFQLEAGGARSGSLTRPSESCAPGEIATSEEQMWLFNMEGMRGMKTLTSLLLSSVVLSAPPPHGLCLARCQREKESLGATGPEVSHPSRQSKGG